MTGRNATTLARGAWYLWDHDRSEVVRGPYKTAEAAGAVRSEIEGDRNLWVVTGRLIDNWREALAARAPQPKRPGQRDE